MLISVDKNSNYMKNVWHKDFFDASKSRLSDKEFKAMTDELNRIVQKNLDDKSEVIVTGYIPGSDWSDTVWEAIYSKACGYDEEYSALFFGLLVCYVLINRDETWYFLKQDDAKSMKYFTVEEKIKKSEEEIEVKVTTSFYDLKNKFGG